VEFSTVTIYAHTPSAPEFGVVDMLIVVTDITGDGFGFEENFGEFSTSTITFNTDVNSENTVSEVRLDRRIFGNGCYANPRNYQLSYASGHQEVISVSPPSPCKQGHSLLADTSSINWMGWEHSYCSNEDYKSNYNVTALSTSSNENQYQNVVRCVPHGTGSNTNETKFPVPAATAKGLMKMGDLFTYNVFTSTNGAIPTKGHCAIEAQESLGLNPDDYINGNTEYGSPLQIGASQVSRLDHVILSFKDFFTEYGIDGISPYTGFAYIKSPSSWFNLIEMEGQYSLLDDDDEEMMPSEGFYGVIREYAYSENLISCQASAPLEIDVCMDDHSPSYYLTSEEDCSGVSITNWINGTNGSWIPKQGPQGCCAVDCSNFNMQGFASTSVFGGATGTITIFLGGLGNPNLSANEHSYDVSITHSSGSAITQNGNSAYSSGDAITDSTCDTVNGSSIVTCNSNVSITLGMKVTGTGIDGTAYVGAITSGQPGAVTEFQLSSNQSFNVPVDASSSNTDTTLTFSIGTLFFTWGSLPATFGGDYYEVTVTDDDGCIYSQSFSISELLPIEGCLNSDSINYSSSYDEQCVPDCCCFVTILQDM